MAAHGNSARKWQPKTQLQAVFVKRLREEMQVQGLNPNSLSKRVGAPPQRTIQDVIAGRDPRLETVAGIAASLGLAAHELLRESSTSGVSRRNIAAMPTYPRLLAEPTHRRTKGRDRKKSSR